MDNKNWIQSFTELTNQKLFKERPVSLWQFLSDNHYFGKTTNQGKDVYPKWRKELEFIMNENSKYIPILTGCIGGGKSRCAIWGIGYGMYLHLNLRNPWGYYNLAAGGKMKIIFFNLTKSLGECGDFNVLQNHLQESDWFKKRGRILGKTLPIIHFDLFDYILSSPNAEGFSTQGQDVLYAIMDEVDSPTASPKKITKVVRAVEETLQRFESRFVIQGESLGKFWIVASKQETYSYISTLITKRQKDKQVYIVDIPIWEAKPKTFYCGKTFSVMIGDIFTQSKVLKTIEEKKEVLDKGFRVIEVPVELEQPFERDVTLALRNYAGISTTYFRKRKLFHSEKFLYDCYDSTKEDPIKQITIEMGLKDKVDLINFIDLNKIRVSRSTPRFIHGDVAFSGGGDAYGLAMSCISGWTKVNKVKEDGQIITEKLPVVETDFIMRLKAPKEDQIPLSLVRKFIVDLKKIYGFNIVLCTFDLRLESINDEQLLNQAGLKCEYLSIDRNPQFCRMFKELVEEGRWVCHHSPYFHFEAVNMEDNPETNKVDHPEEVTQVVILGNGNTEELVVKGSSDVFQAVVGSVKKALENCSNLPDVEVMRKLYAKTQEKIDPMKDLWWLDGKEFGSRKTKEEPEKDKKKDLTYADIFRKSQGKKIF